eukprot:6469700-Amphidinium_carterae.1
MKLYLQALADSLLCNLCLLQYAIVCRSLSSQNAKVGVHLVYQSASHPDYTNPEQISGNTSVCGHLHNICSVLLGLNKVAKLTSYKLTEDAQELDDCHSTEAYQQGMLVQLGCVQLLGSRQVHFAQAHVWAIWASKFFR